jgi:four helix bundle protein
MSQHSSEEQDVWERTCADAIRSDILWKLDAYRAALFLLHVARCDSHQLRAAPQDDGIAGQLIRAAGSVSANLGEGYSRPTKADRARFLGYALGSARECLTWYEASRGVLADELIDRRLILVTRMRSLLLGLIRTLRAGTTSQR